MLQNQWKKIQNWEEQFFPLLKKLKKQGVKHWLYNVISVLKIRYKMRLIKPLKNLVELILLLIMLLQFHLTPTEQTEPKRFDLMHDINVRGTFFVTKACIPHLKKSSNAHILTLSPPINLNPKWFGGHVAYTLTKYNMSMMAMGWAAELKQYHIASNALWPKTTIDTAAVRNLLGGEALAKMSRTPEILADAAYYIFSKPSADCTGNCFIDEDVLVKEGITDLLKYSVVPGAQLYKDLFVD